MSKRMSEYNKNIFRLVNGKLSGYRCAHVLYIVHRNEYFVRKVSRLLYRICLFCIWWRACCGKGNTREHEQYAESFMQFFAAS